MRQLLFVVCILLCSHFSSASEVIEMVSPYDNPPFVVNQKSEQGLIYDLASLLSSRSAGKYQFKVTVVPRARLQRLLQRGGVYVVPLVSPKWFDDSDETKYSWTSTLIEDENLLLSSVKHPIEYKGPASLVGKTTASVLGHANAVLSSLEKTGELKSQRVQSIGNGLRMLAGGRIDFMVVGRMSALYLIRDLHLEKTVHISTSSFEHFDRKIMVSPVKRKDLQRWLDGEVQSLRISAEWKKLLRDYYDFPADKTLSKMLGLNR